jgi:hypothetical protein
MPPSGAREESPLRRIAKRLLTELGERRRRRADAPPGSSSPRRAHKQALGTRVSASRNARLRSLCPSCHELRGWRDR